MSERELACICHWGGLISYGEKGDIVYNGGSTEGLIVKGSSSYAEFVRDVQEYLSVDVAGMCFYYTSSEKPNELVRMKGDIGFKTMLFVNDRRADIYIQEDIKGCLEIEPRKYVSSKSSNAAKEEIPLLEVKSISSPAESSHQYQNSYRHVPPITEEGQLFSSPEEFKEAVTLFAFQNHFAYKYMDNSRKYYRLRCTVDKCPWKLSAGCDDDNSIVRVKRFRNIHNHNAQDLVDFKPVVSSIYMGHIFANKIRDRPSYLPRDICNDLKNDFNVNMTYMQSWRAKERAKYIIEGRPEDSYKLVPWMCQRITEAMPGSVVEWTCTPEGRFKQLFVSYSCSIVGFHNGCRPFLALDACHLSGNYKGTLLNATAYDADDGLYPLAYAIVSGENDDDWIWFLQRLKFIVGSRVVTIMSDRHPSLIKGVSEVFNSDCHAWCLRHLKENFTKFMNGRTGLKLRGGAKDTVKQVFDHIGYARTKEEYEGALEKMGRIRTELHDWVIQNNPEHWSNYLFPLRRWDKLYSNQAESFNSWVREERQLSVIRLMDGHQRRLTEFLLRKKMEIQKWTMPVGPRTENRIKTSQFNALGFKCMPVSSTECTVFDTKRRGFTVQLGPSWSCSCKEWEMSGIPCPHACCAVEKLSLNIYKFVDPYFLIDAQVQIYDQVMSSIPTHDMPDPLHTGKGSTCSTTVSENGLNFSFLKPPATKRPPGRPRVKRIESQFQEKRRITRCSRCHGLGHNRRRCKNVVPDE